MLPSLLLATFAISLPITFEKNIGQATGDVQFIGQVDGREVYLRSDGVASGDAGIRFEGGNPHPAMVPERSLGATANYLRGSDEARWIRDVPLYESVLYRNVYPGIDVRVRASEGRLEYDFLLAAGADPGEIRLRIPGARVESGSIVGPAFRQLAPIVTQDGKRVASRTVALGGDLFGFRLGSYDRRRSVVIDPVVVYATYLGGFARVAAVKSDAAGNFYLTGTVGDDAFPITDTSSNRRSNDAFVMKLGHDGKLIYSTRFGGTYPQFGTALDVDREGNVYVTGITDSLDFPTTPGALKSVPGGTRPAYLEYDDAFVVKLNRLGNKMLYSARVGADLGVSPRAIAVDDAGRAYVTGDTAGGYPVTAGAAQKEKNSINFYTGFVFRLNTSGTQFDYSTYLGGSSATEPASIAVSHAGSAFVGGATWSPDFPVRNGFQSAWSGVAVYTAQPGSSWTPVKAIPAATSIAFHPSNPAVVFVGALSGGIYKSTDGGATWRLRMFDHAEAGLDVFGFVFDPVTPSTMYAMQSHTVLQRSTDGGETWEQIDWGPSWSGPAALLIQPNNPAVMIQASIGGISRTQDGGKSWKRVIDYVQNCRFLIADPTQPSTFYVAAGVGTGSEVGIWRSKDSGVTWNRIFNGSIPMLVVDPNNPNTLYGPYIKSVDSGAHWISAGNGLSGSVNAMVFEPSSRILYAATTSGVFRSGDGENWTPVVDGMANLQVTALAVNSRQLFAVTDSSSDGFVLKLDDTGAIAWSTLLGGAGHDAVTALALASDGSVYAAGETSSLDFRVTAGAFQEKYRGSGDGFLVRLNPDGRGLRFGSYFGGASTDTFQALAVDSSDRAITVGRSGSLEYPTTPDALATTPFRENGSTFYDGAVTLWTPDGRSPVYSTLLGGVGITVTGAALSPSGMLAIVGGIGAAIPPVTPDAMRTSGSSYFLMLRMQPDLTQPPHPRHPTPDLRPAGRP